MFGHVSFWIKFERNRKVGLCLFAVCMEVHAETDFRTGRYQAAGSIREGFGVLANSVFLDLSLGTVRVNEGQSAVVNGFVASDGFQLDGLDIPVFRQTRIRNNVRPPIGP